MQLHIIMFPPLSLWKTHWRDLISEGNFFLHDGNGDIIIVWLRLIPVAMSDKVTDSDVLDRLPRSQ